MVIDSSTRRNLELTSTISGAYKGSLLSNINYTITKPGARLLHGFLSSPVLNRDEIIFRQDNIEYLHNNISLKNQTREMLKSVSDIERILIRISSSRSIPRDMLALKDSLISAKKISALLVEAKQEFHKSIIDALKDFDEVIDLCDSAIREDAPNNLASGNIIKKSYDSALSDLYDLVENSDQILGALKDEYRKKTGIESLKICNNNVIGMYIEVTPKNAHKMNHEEFIHKQTLASAVRHTSERIREIELGKNNAHIQIVQIEQRIYNDICSKIMESALEIRALASKLAMLDVFSALAHLAIEYNYTRPIIDESTDFDIRDGRHVNVEVNLPRGSFIPNDCNLSRDQRLWLLTGPNMAGKSTFLRQNAIIAILAQMGSFVPASYAKIGIIDKLFSRIGASDDISKGQSTFMVEMIEAAAILANSTERSFIILDEVGRGTSTYDGLSIAWGCLEYIHNKLLSRCLFATHYHELTILSKTEPALKNYTMDIREENGKLIFLHKVIEGIADKSYGIHVAELAGLPKPVVKRAYQVLSNLSRDKDSKERDINNIISNNYNLFDMESAKIEERESEVERKLGDVKPDELSPKEALDILYELKKELA
jgi:DNA mismatch repair protein MutS